MNTPLEQSINQDQAVVANVTKLLGQSQASGSQIIPEWTTPSHREVDPFDPEYDEVVAEHAANPLKAHAEIAVTRGFHIFPLQPKKKEPYLGSNGFKDAKPDAEAWDAVPAANIGIATGESDLCVLDFDKPGNIPAWLNETKTYKVRTAKGVHIYFRGARKSSKLYVSETVVGDIKSIGGYVLGAGSIHPDGPKYTVIDYSPIAPLPDISTLIRHDAGRVNASEDGPPIPYGSHDTELFRIACLLRNAGMNYQEIRDALINICLRRCENHGSDYVDMCEKKARSACKYPVGQANPGLGLLWDGKPLVQQPSQESQQTAASETKDVAPVDWSEKFLGVSELEQGEVQMLIEDFLPEGTTFIGGLPGEGKTFFALSIVRALTTGKPFLNAFMVPKTVPVIYLIPESGGRAFRKRLEKFEIPHDRSKFLCRTVSEGATLPLDDDSLLEAVRRMKPVVILDTIIRFSESEDENAATQNKKLVDDVIRLRQAGAVAVIGLHHATKAMREKGMSLELALRGTGDIAATADAVYGLLRDSKLHNGGLGPNEIDVECLKARDFEQPKRFRVASTRKRVPEATDGQDGIRLPSSTESIIDIEHDFRIVSHLAQASQISERIEKLVIETPTITLKELNDITGISQWQIRQTLDRMGYHRGRGGKKGATHWTKEPEKVDMSNIRVEPGQADVDLDAEAA